MILIPFMIHTQLAAIDLNLLVTLDVLLVEESVTVAARRLGLSQSAVSRSLAKLREIFDDELFVRTGHGLRPTERARTLAAPLRAALTDLGGLLSAREPFDPRTAERRFHIAALDYTQLTLIGPWTATLTQRAPRVELVIRQPSPATKRDLEDGSLDLFITPRLRSAAGVVWSPLHDDDLVCVVWDRHPALEFDLDPDPELDPELDPDPQLDLDRFAALDHVLVSPGERPGGIVDDALARHALSRRVVVVVPNFLSVPYVLEGTERIATLPSRLARELVRRYPLRTLAPPVELPTAAMCMAFHEIHRRDPAHRWLRDQLVEAARV